MILKTNSSIYVFVPTSQRHRYLAYRPYRFWNIPGADHMLAQLLKRCRSSRIKPNETLELAKKETKHTLFWGVWVCERKDFFTLSPSYAQSSKKPWKISLSDSFAVEMGHFDMARWKYDSVCIFSMLQDTLELILWKKADKTCKDQKRSIFSRRVLW